MKADVVLWGRTIGSVAIADDQAHAAFRYDSAFVASGIQVAPLMMPLSDKVYEFPALSLATFHGLPGLLADSLPDKFGNALIDAWLASRGLTSNEFGTIERLCYVGSRAMGALEFKPAKGPPSRTAVAIDVASLVELASLVLQHRGQLAVQVGTPYDRDALQEILRVGTSAGGARAKAVVAWNRTTNELRSGQVAAGDGFEAWLIKFDGVANNEDRELADAQSFGAIEYAYHLMARAARITMSDCHLYEESQRRHFMTRRFDRLANGEKLHMQSLGAMCHFDFNQPGAYSYEQAIMTIQQLGLPMSAIEEMYRRMAFNIIARNQDDHVKNIAFLMDKKGQWSLAPAFDVTYSFNPTGAWTSRHQMTLNQKRDKFTMSDFKSCAKVAGMKRGRDAAILEEVREAVASWPRFADLASVPKSWTRQIAKSHRLSIAE